MGRVSDKEDFILGFNPIYYRFRDDQGCGAKKDSLVQYNRKSLASSSGELLCTSLLLRSEMEEGPQRPQLEEHSRIPERRVGVQLPS